MNEIIHGDCLEVMRSMPDETFKTIITSPPYNIGGKHANLDPQDWLKTLAINQGYGGSRSLARLKIMADFHMNGFDGRGAMPHQEYVRWQKECLTEMWRLLRPDGAIWYNHKERVQNKLRVSPEEIVGDFPVRQTIIWDTNSRGHINPQGAFFAPSFQLIYLIPKTDFRIVPPHQYQTAVWNYPQGRDSTKNKIHHPCPFPVELPLRCLRASGPGPVLDPFAGSGTTGVAAKMLGADYPYTLIDTSEKYCQMARERLGLVQPLDQGPLFV